MKNNHKKRIVKRKKKTAENFTPSPLVNEMLDNLPQDFFANPSKTYLDPSCGIGNILIEVLKRRMRFMSPLQAISNIYGCDIMKDDIRELRERIYNLMPKEKMTIQEIKEVIRCLLNHFIYVKDALTYDFSFPKKASNENVELYYKNHNIKSEQSCIISENRIGNDSRNSTTIKK